MPRDLDLIRKLLFWIEEHCDGSHTYSSVQVKIEGYSLKEINLHLSLMKEANLICLVPSPRANPKARNIQFTRLTNEGYELLDAIRNTSTWNTVKEKVLDLGGSCALSVVKDLAIQILKLNCHF